MRFQPVLEGTHSPWYRHIPSIFFKTFTFLSVCFSTITFRALKDSNASSWGHRRHYGSRLSRGGLTRVEAVSDDEVRFWQPDTIELLHRWLGIEGGGICEFYKGDQNNEHGLRHPCLLLLGAQYDGQVTSVHLLVLWFSFQPWLFTKEKWFLIKVDALPTTEGHYNDMQWHHSLSLLWPWVATGEMLSFISCCYYDR
jgi:hypothetical protein